MSNLKYILLLVSLPIVFIMSVILIFNANDASFWVLIAAISGFGSIVELVMLTGPNARRPKV